MSGSFLRLLSLCGLCLSLPARGFSMPEGFSLTSNLGYHTTSNAVGAADGAKQSLSGFAFDLGGDYRFASGFALGAVYFRSLYSLSDQNQGTLTYSGIMFTPRYYYPLNSVILAGEVGLGWSWFTAKTASGNSEFGFEASGQTVSAGAGVLYPVLPNFSVGAFTRFSFPFFSEVCFNLGGERSCGKPTNSSMMDIFYGVGLAYFMGAHSDTEAKNAAPVKARSATHPGKKRKYRTRETLQ